MSYTTPKFVRENVLGVPVDEAPDAQLQEYIELADKVVMVDISTRVELEKLQQAIDGSGKKFQVKHFPIADINADSLVDGQDVEVKGWKTESDFDSLTVANVLADKGIIILAEKPDLQTYKLGLTADYSYYPNPIDFNLVSLASAKYAAYLWLVKEHSLMPLKLKMGGRFGFETSYGYTVPTYPYDKMLEQYHLLINKIRTKSHRVTTFEKVRRPERKIPGVLNAVEISG